MPSSLNRVCFSFSIVVLVLINTVALTKVRAAEIETGYSPVLLPSESSTVVLGVDYVTSLDLWSEDRIRVLEKIQKQEAQKIQDELQRRQLEAERLRREAEEAARRRARATSSIRQVNVSVSALPVPPRIFGDFEGAIRSSCAIYGCNPEQLIRVMYCESGGRSNAVNGIHKGLFQFNPRTFEVNARRAGVPGANIWDPYSQITVAAWMFANGQAWQWSCK